MTLTGPDDYRLLLNPSTFTVVCPTGRHTFSGRAATDLPKLYIASVKGEPIYVGVTKQAMRARLRLGFTATGDSGYYGYAWRHALNEVDLRIWYQTDAPADNPILDLETIEAEVVFLIRSAGQWPRFQTEIHFHASRQAHRTLAAEILARYTLPRFPAGASVEQADAASAT